MSDAPIRIVIAGHVDHGKSTLIGRLLHDTGSLNDGALQAAQAASAQRGVEFEWSYLLDAFQAERDLAITIDTAQVVFQTQKRPYVMIDAPGHREFLKNMMSGASGADAAILVIDASEGLREQTKRHAYLLTLIGIDHIIVAVTKMDKIGYDQKAFDVLSVQIRQHVTPHNIIPVDARAGEMIAGRSDTIKWYHGPTVTEALDAITVKAMQYDNVLLPVQSVYRQDGKRIIAGRLESGALKVGDELTFFPTHETTRIAGIEHWPDPKEQACAGECIGLTLEQPIFIERGHVASNQHLSVYDAVVMKLFWLDAHALKIGDVCNICVGTQEVAATVQSISDVIDPQDMSAQPHSILSKNLTADVTLRLRSKMVIAAHPSFDRAVIFRDGRVAGAGMIDAVPLALKPQSENVHTVRHAITPEMRAARAGHKGAIFWLTGLPGAGKSTLAMAAEQALFARGINAYVLDGDNLRHGLNGDLGFSPDDRRENIRRAGEVAALQADAGLVVLASFISPYQDDRARARTAAPHQFHEIYISADVETCEARDPKGHYKKARAGGIKNFTGVDSPYETPMQPDLVIDTDSASIESCVAQLVDYILSQVRLFPAAEKILETHE